MVRHLAEADARAGRDRAVTGLMLIAALGALFSFAGAVGATAAAGPEAQMAEVWRMYGSPVFAGPFVLLALRPRRSPGVWELVVFHKTGTAVAVADGVLAAVTVIAYSLSRGYVGWKTLRADGAKSG